MLPSTIPIFPLPNVVLFPTVFLPLHIFEPRYRAMVADALVTDRIIGMTLLKPGWESDYDGRPPVYPVGCAGLITHAERLDDGRYDIVLQGVQKFRIEAERNDREYRRAAVVAIEEHIAAADREALRQERVRLEALLSPADGYAAELQLARSMADDDLINALAQYLDLEPVERQALLERDGPLARCRSLIDLIEMKAIASDLGDRWAI